MPGTQEAQNLKTRAAEFLADPRFHQTFSFAAPSLGVPDFRVSYCDYGAPADGDDQRVVLICGPMMGSRWLYLPQDKLAARHGVRVIHPDRPGFGETTEVPIERRIDAWIAMVPALLNHLGIKHVSLLCHSGGTVYGLNTVLRLRNVLHPTRPYVALCAPWVHYTHTDSVTMHLTQYLPQGLISKFDGVARFVTKTVDPILGGSSAFISSFLPKSETPIAEGVNPADVELVDCIAPHIGEQLFLGNTRGLPDEALFLLKRCGRDDDWGTWRDYDQLVPLLAAGEEGRAGKLRIEVFYAEADVMIGTTKGPAWFNACWSEEKRGPNIDYSFSTVPGTDHDGILSIRRGLAERIYRRVGYDGPE